ncbi:hypothetical protein C2G38_2247366 [Gigaspora rosea]|uniref:Uncharacterized protein n=1 Tax=Gigaspora rosea TaxID=44941 RepID=A0A397V7B5_9GLOM|nr:hypothetical protein C2G38_2247366 [Gigaspora rosea]
MVYSEEWLKNTIHEGYFKSYDHSEFSVHKPIGKGDRDSIIWFCNWRFTRIFKDKLSKLEWTDKLRLARIIHRDFVSVIHDEKLLIADLAYQKTRSKTSNVSIHGVFGVILWEISSGKCNFSMLAHLDSATTLDIDPSGMILVSGEFVSHWRKFDEGVLCVESLPWMDSVVKIYC